MNLLTKKQSPKYTSSSYCSIGEKQTAQSKSGQMTKTDISPKKKKQMTNKYMKRWLTSLIIREMQIKITMRYQLTLDRMAIIKKSTNNKC